MCEGWTFRRLDELGGKKRPVLKAGPFGSAVTKDKYVEDGYKVYGQQEVVSGNVHAERYYISQKAFSNLKSCAVEAGDILITMMGTVGRLFLVPPDAEPGIINPRLMRISLDKTITDPAFVAAFLGSSQMQRLLERRAHGGTMLGLNADALGSLSIPVPPLPEQRKIAEILRTWDEAIEKLEALRAVKERRLHSLREKLTYVNAEGEPIRLGDVTEEVSTRNGDGRLGRGRVMGVTNSRGIVPMREQTIAEDISRYKVVPHQAFAYNPMRINVGSIAMNEASEEILVSPDYVVFACLHDQLSPDFLDHLRNTKWWAHYITSGGSGSVRQRTYYDDLAAMKVPLPDFERQRRIADILNTARRDVEATTREITALTRQKRGLMQKLLTGEWRVKQEWVGA